MKRELYSRLARATADKRRDREALREEVAKRYHLKVVSGRIPIPDLRIEYANENDDEIQRRDLELATEHYRPRGLSEKARAGFELYARRGETDPLRRIRDDRELNAAIFSLWSMTIPEDKLATLRAFGCTEVEARFFYLVATHSGYFTLRQFLDFWALGRKNDFVFYNQKTGEPFVDLDRGLQLACERRKSRE